MSQILIHTTPPQNPLAGDMTLNLKSGQILMHDGSQWVAVDPTEPFDPSWTLHEINGMWVLRIHPKVADEVDDFIVENNLRGYRVEREVIFAEFDEAALVRLKYQ